MQITIEWAVALLEFGGCKIDFRFFSIVRHASTQRRMLTPMASQNLRIFERGLSHKKLTNKRISSFFLGQLHVATIGRLG